MQCERLRIQLSQVDHERDFLPLLQRANRANVSFYPVDARGLLVFDQPTNFDILPTDGSGVSAPSSRFPADMAAQTDGQAVLIRATSPRALQKIFRDVGSYYLMSYYSTNSEARWPVPPHSCRGEAARRRRARAARLSRADRSRSRAAGAAIDRARAREQRRRRR